MLERSLFLGSCPTEEEPTNKSPEEMLKECHLFIYLLRNKFKKPQGIKVSFRVCREDSDKLPWGFIYYVAIEWNPTHTRSEEYAHYVQKNLPSKWTD